MSKYIKRFAREIGVDSYYVKNMEGKGHLYLLQHHSPSIGAQCGKCYIIVWLDPRADEVLSEIKPSIVPEYGAGYTKYYTRKIERFLSSLNKCPECNSLQFTKYISNLDYPKFENGGAFNIEDEPFLYLDNESIDKKVWWVNP